MSSLKGTFTALITPFSQAALDEQGLRLLIQRQCQHHIAGLVVLGTTAESATLSEEEQERIVDIAIEEGKGKTLIIVGTGSSCTQKTIAKTRWAKEKGADAALVIAPYYNKPTQEGIYAHFKAIARAVNLPLILYNHPGRTGVNIELSTLLKLAQLPSVVGLKEASSDLNQLTRVAAEFASHSYFSLLGGNDEYILPFMAMGAKGAISVTSNLFPERVDALVQALLNNEIAQARTWHRELLPLFELMGIETNPIPIKALMQMMGLPAGSCRLPLTLLREENREQLQRWTDQECKVFS